MTKTPATLQRIADEAGVSYMTVARVLRGETRGAFPAAAERARKIRRIADRLNYKPNSAARATVTGRFGTIGVLLKHNQTFLPPQLLQGTNAALHKHQMQATLAHMPQADLTDETCLPRVFRELTVDGLLINFMSFSDQTTTQLLDAHRLPAVWVNQKHHFDCAYINEYSAAYEITEHLIALGHRRIARAIRKTPEHIEEPTHHSIPDRLAGCEKAMQDAGLVAQSPIHAFEPPEPDCQPARERFDQALAILDSPERPTAIVCLNTHQAIPLARAAAWLQLRVPEDLCIVTFSAGDRNSGWDMEIIDVQIPMHAVGQASVEVLMKKLAAPHEHIEPRQVDYEPVGERYGRPLVGPASP